MRKWINLFERFGTTETLYHGLSIDSLWLVLKDGKLHTEMNGWGHAGPAGVCLSRSFKVAAGHSKSQTDNLYNSFFEFFELGQPPHLDPVVLEFDRSKINGEIIHYDDGAGDEEEERVVGELPLEPALKHIWVNPKDLHTFLEYATRAFKNGGEEYNEEFRAIIQNVLKDPRLKAL